MMVLTRPDAYRVWNVHEVKERLRWYRAVMEDKSPAKFQVCKTIPVEQDLKETGTEALWEEHRKLSERASGILRETVAESVWDWRTPLAKVSFIDLKAELAERILGKCSFCEWNCQVDRAAGKTGFCRLDASSFVSCYFHHYGEEAPLVSVKGRGGSGTIFFESCNFRCVFCQNNDISQIKSMKECSGIPVTPQTLAMMADDLRAEGAANINYVGGEPTPNLHIILNSLRHMKHNAPLLWNSNMYCSLSTMKLLADIIDIWLPDFKYGNNKCAQKLSWIGSRASYLETATRNHALAAKNGDMIIRHLVLPGHVECCTKPILSWVAENIGDRVLINIMDQYHPDNLVLTQPEKYREINRRPRREEMEQVYSYASALGLVYEPVS